MANSNVPTTISPGVPAPRAQEPTQSPPCLGNNVPAFDSIAPAPMAPPVETLQPYERPTLAPGEWFAVILAHHCHDEFIVELYPTEREADEAAERIQRDKLDGHDAGTYSELSGCSVELVVVPAYIHGITATIRTWPKLGLDHK
jgi:hypothetical protein